MPELLKALLVSASLGALLGLERRHEALRVERPVGLRTPELADERAPTAGLEVEHPAAELRRAFLQDDQLHER